MILAEDLKEAWESIDLEQMAEKWHRIHCDLVDADSHFPPSVFDGRSMVTITAGPVADMKSELVSHLSALEDTDRPYVFSAWMRSHDLDTGEVLEEDVVSTVAVHPDRDHIYRIFHCFVKKEDKIVWGEKRVSHTTRSNIAMELLNPEGLLA